MEREGEEKGRGVLRGPSAPNGSAAVVGRFAIRSGAVVGKEGRRREEGGREAGNKSETKCIGQCSGVASRVADRISTLPARPGAGRTRTETGLGACISRH